jgi:hypothetical protein
MLNAPLLFVNTFCCLDIYLRITSLRTRCAAVADARVTTYPTKGKIVTTPLTSDSAVLEIDPGGFPSGLTHAVLIATRRLGGATPQSSVTISVPAPPSDLGEREALREALRSLVHGSILERPEVRANLVFGGPADDHRRTVEYVNSAPFVIGASIDLGVAA